MDLVNQGPSASRDSEPPAELAPKKRGRPLGSTNKPKETIAEVSREALANAWHGLWLLCKLATWGLAGRVSAPIARWTSATYTLDDLPNEEALEDAKNLLPIFRNFPALALVLTWIGAPVLLAKRVQAHLRREPFTKPDPRPVRPLPAAAPQAGEYTPEPGLSGQ